MSMFVVVNRKKWNRNVFGHIDIEIKQSLSIICSLQGTQLTEAEEK